MTCIAMARRPNELGCTMRQPSIMVFRNMLSPCATPRMDSLDRARFLCDAQLETLARGLRVAPALVPVNERIRCPCCATRELAVEVEETRVRREQDVALQARDGRDARTERVDDARPRSVAREAEIVRGYRVQAVGVDDVYARALLAGLPRPGRPAGRMAGRQVRCECGAADALCLAIGDYPQIAHGRKTRRPHCELRIVRRRPAAERDRTRR